MHQGSRGSLPRQAESVSGEPMKGDQYVTVRIDSDLDFKNHALKKELERLILGYSSDIDTSMLLEVEVVHVEEGEE